MREEILADFTGDALADPQFLQALATNNPTKFRLFVDDLLAKFQDMCDGHVQGLERKGILPKGKQPQCSSNSLFSSC